MKNITKYAVAPLLCLLLMQGPGCKKEDYGGLRKASFNAPFDLKLSEKVLLTSAEREIMIELRGMNDDRCKDLPCEHAGSARARIFLQDKGNHSEAETNLCIGACDEKIKTSDTVLVSLDGLMYSLILKNIHGSADKKAELLISKD